LLLNAKLWIPANVLNMYMRVPNPYCHRGNSSPAKTFLFTLDLEQKGTSILTENHQIICPFQPPCKHEEDSV
jgi:hypothetical protein